MALIMKSPKFGIHLYVETTERVREMEREQRERERQREERERLTQREKQTEIERAGAGNYVGVNVWGT